MLVLFQWVWPVFKVVCCRFDVCGKGYLDVGFISVGMGRVEEREIRARLDGALARVVEGMGISRDVLTRVIWKRLMENGQF